MWRGACGPHRPGTVLAPRGPRDRAARPRSVERRGGCNPSGGTGLRRAYALVLWLSCVYYYASIPLLALLTLALGGGILYAMFAVGRIPIKLALIVAVLTLATLWSILKSLFARGRDQDPGERLRAARPPAAARRGGRGGPPDRDPRGGQRLPDAGTDVAVMERGGLGRQLRGGSERCLVLGVGRP